MILLCFQYIVKGVGVAGQLRQKLSCSDMCIVQAQDLWYNYLPINGFFSILGKEIAWINL